MSPGPRKAKIVSKFGFRHPHPSPFQYLLWPHSLVLPSAYPVRAKQRLRLWTVSSSFIKMFLLLERQQIVKSSSQSHSSVKITTIIIYICKQTLISTETFLHIINSTDFIGLVYNRLYIPCSRSLLGTSNTGA